MANNPFPCFWFIQRTLKKEAARLMIQKVQSGRAFRTPRSFIERGQSTQLLR